MVCPHNLLLFSVGMIVSHHTNPIIKSLHKGEDQVIASSRNHAQRWNEVMEKSDHSVTLIDLCGESLHQMEDTLFRWVTFFHVLRGALFLLLSLVSILYQSSITTQLKQFLQGNLSIDIIFLFNLFGVVVGHEKYLKTTLFGLTGLMPDYCLLVVGSNMGVQLMTREHISIACALNIPMFVAVTKIDICPPK